MPFGPRATAPFVLGLVAALAFGTVLIAGCGSSHAATGFCATIHRGHRAFNSTDEADAPRALAQFDRIVASAPAAVAPDLKIVGAFLHELYRDPAGVANNPPLVERYTAATRRVDRYLHKSCGIEIPPAGVFF